MSILRGSYAWSFFKNDHSDLAVAGGLYGMAVEFKLKPEAPVVIAQVLMLLSLKRS